MYNKATTKKSKYEDKLSAAMFRTFFFLGGMFLIIHVLACIWVKIGLSYDGTTWLTLKLAGLEADTGEQITYD